MRDPAIMAAMARAAEMGGAAGIRANGPEDTTAILDAVSLPVLGLNKVAYPDSPVYITPSVADVEPLIEAGCRMIALDAGVDAIGTTLSGYTSGATPPQGPDLALVQELARRVSIPVYAEGRYSTPEHVAKARQLGASFVVVGSAITDPVALTRNLASPLREESSK